jgi:uncharacterized protein (DUF2236 family)
MSLFASDAAVRQVNGEGVLLLGGGRALLMQLAHPLVARGVADHSDFEHDAFARLRRTLEASFTMVFGSADEARRTAEAVRAVHDRVTGAVYAANDPALLLWVHATLVDTAIRVYQRFVGPLSDGVAGRYYEESTVIAELLGVPRHRQPADLPAFREFVRTSVATLEVSETARRLAHAVLHPDVPWFGEPLFALARQITVGLLPLPLRLQYGLRWDSRRKAALDAAAATSRRLLPRVPPALRRAPALNLA